MMQSRFTHTKEERNGVAVFILKGSLDIATVSNMRSDIEAVIAAGHRKILFDLDDLEQIDSSGIGAIIALFKKVRSNRGDVKISRLRGQPKEIFSLLRLDRVFEMYDDFDKALTSFQ
ncbi:anti-sigma factor antagonist [candidate division KSB3 bacterium]|jgi:anti-sigma B factor antagonist|uniref:Anti-sigma factor antagonist n=1 Tax=candidate division KSB3 bacterium TaxID=2044937 RepID=A0A9D5Q5S7_9BACT|nr:anti-sigma factor antagonist [candidate division KSB3 bacterium]MBD3325139.1 anti-sigma factor antagonist [candidate division KSB3 bacterium]